MKRVIIIVLDAVGIGELPDASLYDDKGSDTLMHIKEQIPAFNLPNMQALGLGNIPGHNLFDPVPSPKGIYGKMKEHSKGKDTTTGHWEIAGVWLDKPFPTYPNGFDKDIIDLFCKETGCEILGNKVASGTVIINELGDEHVKTGKPIVYTSADSVFQIAAHEDVIPLERLYEMCKIARKITPVGRVIARPFTGTSGNYVRTSNRHDFSLEPTQTTLLDEVVKNRLYVSAVGKINDIFAGRSITQSVHTSSNAEGIEKTIEYIKTAPDGLIFTNLVDTDMLYGHRRDVKGFAAALEYFDRKLPEILTAMSDEDLLFITSDHGCDPTYKGTDHTREHALLLGYGKSIKPFNAGIRSTFADLGKSAASYLGIKAEINGEEFL